MYAMIVTHQNPVYRHTAGPNEPEVTMSFTAVTVPQQTRTAKPVVTEAEVKELVKMLKAGKTPSDGELYQAQGKSDAKTRAYLAGYKVRVALVKSGAFAPTHLSVRTWADGDGARWALKL